MQKAPRSGASGGTPRPARRRDVADPAVTYELRVNGRCRRSVTMSLPITAPSQVLTVCRSRAFKPVPASNRRRRLQELNALVNSRHFVPIRLALTMSSCNSDDVTIAVMESTSSQRMFPPAPARALDRSRCRSGGLGTDCPRSPGGSLVRIDSVFAPQSQTANPKGGKVTKETSRRSGRDTAGVV